MRIEYKERRDNGRPKSIFTAFTIIPDNTPPEAHHYKLYLNWERDTSNKNISFIVSGFTFFICTKGLTRSKQLFHTLRKEFPAGQFADFTKSEDRQKAGHHLLEFLFLQPGDTDAEYFEKFNKAEMDFILKYGPEINMILQGELNE